MKRLLAYLFIVLSLSLVLSFSSYAQSDDQKKINEISKNLISIKELLDTGVLDESSYNNARNKLIKQRNEIINKNKKNKQNKKVTQLDKEIEVIEKLFNEGLLTEDEYNKTKNILIEKSGKRIDKIDVPSIPYELNFIIKGKTKPKWEKVEIIFGDYQIKTFRPGGIKVIRISDGKKLAQITDNFKIKFYNNGENFISFKKSQKKPETAAQTLNRVLDSGSDDFILKNLFKKKEKKAHNPDENKLELFIEGNKILHWEGRYNAKYHAMFYQVLTRDFSSFHFYIKVPGRPVIALNMGLFNKKIDRAVRAAKEKIADEYDISMKEIDKILDRKIDEEINKGIDKSVEEAVAKSVAAAIQQSVGEAMAASLANAIEEATGEAIEDSIESELAAAIDTEIARAVALGIEEAAVTAGWQAYFDVIAQGGTLEQASDAAYKACGSACDNY